MNTSVLCSILLVLFHIEIIFAQQTGFEIQYYSMNEGLPSNEVYQAIQTKDGKIWFATNGGITCFDGYEFKNITTEDGLVSNTIFRLFEDDNNRIWYTSFTEGIGYLEDGQVKAYRHNESLKNAIEDMYVLKLQIEDDEHISFSTYRYGMGEVNPDGKVTFQKMSGDTSLQIIASDSDKPPGKLRLTDMKRASNFICIYPDGREVLIDRGKIRMNQLYQIGNTFYVGYAKDEACYLVEIGDKGVRKREIRSEITMLFFDDEKRFWLAEIQMGIRVFKDIDAFFHNQNPVFTLLKQKNVAGIMEDRDGSMWISIQDGGVAFISNLDFETINIEENLNNNCITDIVRSTDNMLFYSTLNGEIFRIDQCGEHELIQTLGKGEGVHGIHIGDDPNKLLILKKSGEDNYYNTSNNVKGYLIREFNTKSLTITSDNEILFFSGRLIRKISPDSRVEKFGNQFFYTLFHDGRKTWLGGKDGLYCLEEDVISLVNDKELTGNIAVRKIALYEENVLVLAIDDKGIFFVDVNGTPKVLGGVRIKEKYLKHIYVDDDKDLWLSSDNGVILIKMTSFQDYSLQKFKTIHGLSSNEVNAVASRGDTIYIATANGITQIKKAEVTLNSNPPKLELRDIRVNDKSVGNKAIHEFSYQENDLKFLMNAIVYRLRGVVTYAYMLEGWDEHWRYTLDREVYYAQLNPGNYKFRFKAANEDGVWSKEKILQISIEKPFWRRLWFLIFCMTIVIIIVFWLIRIRERKVQITHERIQKQELQKRKIAEAELRSLRLQMNPHFTFNALNAIQSLVLNADKNTAADTITEFSTLLRKVLENSRYSLIPLSEELKMIELYVNIENLRLDNSIQFELDLAAEIDPNIVKIPSLILQPFVENAIVHGLLLKKEGQKKLNVSICIENDLLACTVTDNGVGRIKAAEVKRSKKLKKASYGIKITRDRLERLYGVEIANLFSIIDLHNDLGKAAGTTLKLFFKMNTEKV